MTDLTHLSLFSGIGGLDLAAEAAGFQTAGQCEWADYPTKVLEKHWPGVPRWRDIRTLTGDDFYARTGRRSVTVISGGFPCQPFSVAGKRRGKEDDRYLWPEMCRVISEIRPAWAIGENVPGIINLALDTVLSDLESQGYACQTFIIPAAGVDAPHRRERIAIVANSIGRGRRQEGERKGLDGISGERQDNAMQTSEPGTDVSHADRDGSNARWPESERQQREAGAANGSNAVAYSARPGWVGSARTKLSCESRPSGSGEDVADTLRIGSTAGLADTSTGEKRDSGEPFNDGAITSNAESAERQRERRETRGRRPELGRGGWWPVEPDVGRVANGIPSRVDRLKCLGNAVVPAQFYPFFKYIAEIERNNK